MTEMPLWLDLLVAITLVVGALFALVGCIGLIRLPDFFLRLHAPTKATTLGVGGILLAAIVVTWWDHNTLSLRELLITALALLTAPISAHMLIKAQLHLKPTARPKPPKSKREPPSKTTLPDVVV